MFLNFRVGVGQRGFWIKGVKCIERNPLLAVLCRMAGILVFRSSDKRDLTAYKFMFCPDRSKSRAIIQLWPTLNYRVQNFWYIFIVAVESFRAPMDQRSDTSFVLLRKPYWCVELRSAVWPIRSETDRTFRLVLFPIPFYDLCVHFSIFIFHVESFVNPVFSWFKSLAVLRLLEREPLFCTKYNGEEFIYLFQFLK